MEDNIRISLLSASSAVEYLYAQQDTIESAYIKGSVNANNAVIDYLRTYLWQIHGIDKRCNGWVQQVDHYAFERNLSWEQAFHCLVSEMCESFYNPPAEIQSPYERNAPKIQDSPDVLGNEALEIQVGNGQVLRIGTLIRLSDKIGEDYKRTKFYDASLRNPDWSLFYASELDFRHVRFYHVGYSTSKTCLTPFTFGRVR